jgi:hypothetical protein
MTFPTWNVTVCTLEVTSFEMSSMGIIEGYKPDLLGMQVTQNVALNSNMNTRFYMEREF